MIRRAGGVGGGESGPAGANSGWPALALKKTAKKAKLGPPFAGGKRVFLK